MIQRFLDGSDPSRRSTVMALLLASTWGTFLVGLVAGAVPAVIWLMCGLVATKVVRGTALNVATHGGAEGDAAGAPADTSLESMQARVLRRLAAEATPAGTDAAEPGTVQAS
jgi:hypothetical protein